MSSVPAIMPNADAAREAIAYVQAQAVQHDVHHHGKCIRWRRFGEGSPLVLLHGGYGSWMHWVRNIEALALQHTVWVPDMPGYNDSDALDPVPLGRDRLAPLVDALRATLGILIGDGTPVDLAGFSFGGMVAARLAAERGTVRRLALLGVVGHGAARRQWEDMVDWKNQTNSQAVRTALLHNLRVQMLHEPQSIDALALAVHEISCARTRYVSKPISRAGGLQNLLDQYKQPLLMLWGEHDVTAFPELLAPQLCGDHTEREWRLIPGAGHWVQYERASEVNSLMLSWFAQNSAH
jgi:pimeloyl-ACP methyl ester carboxylesterase